MDGRIDSFIGHVSRHRDLRHDFVNDVIRTQAVRIGFVTQDDAMPQAVVDDRAHIIWGDVVASVQPGVGPRDLVKS
jgi:hypothetical protein